MLNLTYNISDEGGQPVNLTLAIINPQTSYQKLNQAQHFQNRNQQLSQMLLAVAQARGGQSSVDFNSDFHSKYERNVTTALSNSIHELITKKGLNISGPFSTFDDMAYGEKLKADLAVIPLLTIFIEKKATNIDSESITNIYTENGVIQIGGELRIDFVEPLTKEKILSKRINLYDLGVQRPYTKQLKMASTGIGSVIAASKKLTDNTDKALCDCINEFYAKSMAKIVKFFSTAELLSYKPQIAKLKSIKRY